MHQSLLITTLFLGLQSNASLPQVSKVYEDFTKKKTELLKADLNKKNFKEKVSQYLKELNQSYDEVKNVESKSKSVLLTTEGNQMAYDIEVLEPLKDLANGLMSKEDCDKARHEHSLNFPIVEDEQSTAIENIINKICNL